MSVVKMKIKEERGKERDGEERKKIKKKQEVLIEAKETAELLRKINITKWTKFSSYTV